MHKTGPPPLAPLNSTSIEKLVFDSSRRGSGQERVELGWPIFEAHKDRLRNQRFTGIAAERLRNADATNGGVPVICMQAGDVAVHTHSHLTGAPAHADSKGGSFVAAGRRCGEEPPVRHAA